MRTLLLLTLLVYTPSQENAIGSLTPTTPSEHSANDRGNVKAQVKHPNMSNALFSMCQLRQRRKHHKPELLDSEYSEV